MAFLLLHGCGESEDGADDDVEQDQNDSDTDDEDDDGAPTGMRDAGRDASRANDDSDDSNDESTGGRADGGARGDGGATRADGGGTTTRNDAGMTGMDAGTVPDLGLPDLGDLFPTPPPPDKDAGTNPPSAGECNDQTPVGCYTPAPGNAPGCGKAPYVPFGLPGLDQWDLCNSGGVGPYQSCSWNGPDGRSINCVCDLGVHWLCVNL